MALALPRGLTFQVEVHDLDGDTFPAIVFGVLAAASAKAAMCDKWGQKKLKHRLASPHWHH